MTNKTIETKNDVVDFLRAYVDTHTCSQGKGKDVFFVSTDEEGADTIIKGLPTGGCSNPHYLSRTQLFELLERIRQNQVTDEELESWEFN